MSTLYIRNPATSLIIADKEVLAVRGNGTVLCLQKQTPQLQPLWEFLRVPRTLSETAAMMNVSLPTAAELLRRLVGCEILISGDREALRALLSPPFTARGPVCNCLVVGISGTFQVVGSAWLGMIAGLKGVFAREVHVILTPGAAKFINADIFSYYGLPVWEDPFAAKEGVNVPHMWLAARADVILVAATAHTIHRLATGACSDLLSLVVAATRAPIVIAPSMNPLMASQPAVARNIEQLRRDGFYIAEPGLARELSNTSDGTLAFGGVGILPKSLTPLLAAVLARNGRGTAPACQLHELGEDHVMTAVAGSIHSIAGRAGVSSLERIGWLYERS